MTALALSTASLLGLVLLSVGTDAGLLRLDSRHALTIDVIAHQWWWEFRYTDPDPARRFVTANEMHVPVGRPVILQLTAEDVIHSFWVPNLAGKKDLLPGRVTELILRADRPGNYRGQCAEFCGYQHAHMAMSVVAEAPMAYDAWASLQRLPAAPPASLLAQEGREKFESGTCALCHTVRGMEAGGNHGPDLTHVASRQMLAAGTLRNSSDNLVRWISHPQTFKPGVNMPDQQLSAHDLGALVAFVSGLQ